MNKKFNTKALAAALIGKMTRRHKSHRDIAHRQWTITPAETLTSKKAIFLEGDLDRVTQTQEETNIALETSRVLGGKKEHAATIAYALPNMELLDGNVYGHGASLRLSSSKTKYWVDDEPFTMDEAVLASSAHGNIYFGHWMSDDLTLHLAAEKLGPVFHSARRSYGHEAQYCSLFGVGQNRLQNACFKNLIVLEDFGQNSDKRDRYQTLKSRLAALPCQGNSKIFIRRGVSAARASRSLQNGAAVEAFLRVQGFLVVDPDTMSAEAIAFAARGASIVIGVEGSHLAHALYTLADKGTLLVLQPPYRFNNVFKDYTDCLDQDYAFLVGTEAEGGFTIDLVLLERLLAKLL